MIDIENIVVDRVINAIEPLKTKYPKLVLHSIPVETVNDLPVVTIWEVDNQTFRMTQDESIMEHHSVITYEANVYVDNVNGKKQITKEIADSVDIAMQNMKFTRTMRSVIPNYDRSIYRITMRYQAIVQEGRAIGNDTVYQMYRT